jgi:hypothetical protein
MEVGNSTLRRYSPLLKRWLALRKSIKTGDNVEEFFVDGALAEA